MARRRKKRANQKPPSVTFCLKRSCSRSFFAWKLRGTFRSNAQGAKKLAQRGPDWEEREGIFKASGGWPEKPLSATFFVAPFRSTPLLPFLLFPFLPPPLSLSLSLSLLPSPFCYNSPVFDVDTSATLHGLPLMTRCADLRIVPACCGNVSDAPDSDDSKWTSWCSSSDDCFRFVFVLFL